MIILTIRKADDSVYWRENFPTLDACNAWLNKERTKFYWKDEYKTEIVDRTAAVAAEIAANKSAADARLALRTARFNQLKTFAAIQDPTNAQLVAAVKLMADLLTT